MTDTAGDDLAAAVTVARRDFDVVADITAGVGAVVAVLGPNGAGKSTLLRALAGLVPIRAGQVRLGDLVLDDPARRIRLPAETRPVGVVFQDYLLFSHLSARRNIGFGLRARGVGRGDADRAADELLERMDLTDVAESRPAQLSGGQAQRVALARALAVRPRLLLLDEPLAALDVAARSTVRSDLRRHVAAYDGVTVLVTHDPLDALVLADSMLILDRGRVVQRGSPVEVARRPRTDYVARVMGINLLAGRADGSVVTLDRGGRLVIDSHTQGDVHVAVRPSAIALYARRPAAGSPRNCWRATVTAIEPRGDGARVEVAGPPDVVVDVTAAAVAELRLTTGTAVWCAAKATEIDAYPR